MEYRFDTTRETDRIIPAKAMLHLPFREEAIALWDENTDLRQFLFDLYDGTGYGDVTAHYYVEARNKFSIWATKFQDAASTAVPAPASVSQQIAIPSFTDDTVFGLVAKSMSAWENTLGNVLAEGTQFSLAHLLESETDLLSSIHLAAHLYYRQALQTLRGFLESIVLPLNFCGNPDEYLRWKSNNYRIPPFRGKNGLLRKLQSQGILQDSLANRVSEIYGHLNAYIHGAEKSLNNRGIGTGRWEGLVFKREDFELWARTFTTVIELGLKLFRIHHKQWEEARARYGDICGICHSKEIVEVTLSSDSKDIRQYVCKKCGFKTHKTRDGKPVVIATVETVDGKP